MDCRFEFGDVRRGWDLKKWVDSHELGHYGTTPEEVLVGIQQEAGERRNRTMEESALSEDTVVDALGDESERTKDALLPEPTDPPPSATPPETTPCNETSIAEEERFDFA